MRLLDQTNIGMTDFLQKVNYRRALEGELARTIIGLNEVAAARVHLVIPEDRLFKEDQHTPTASVVLKLQGSMPLSKRQLQGIAYLVASSVEGMTPDKVTIIDYDGNLLSGTQASDEVGDAVGERSLRCARTSKTIWSRRRSRCCRSVIGAGRAVVRVTAELNFEKSNTQIEQYDPDLVAIRSEQRTTQKGSQLEGAAGGTKRCGRHGRRSRSRHGRDGSSRGRYSRNSDRRDHADQYQQRQFRRCYHELRSLEDDQEHYRRSGQHQATDSCSDG